MYCKDPDKSNSKKSCRGQNNVLKNPFDEKGLSHESFSARYCIRGASLLLKAFGSDVANLWLLVVYRSAQLRH